MSAPPPTAEETLPTQALIVGISGATLLSMDGEVTALSPGEAKAFAAQGRALICHEPGVAARLGITSLHQHFDILDLYAFVRPAQFCLPTPAGLAEALALPPCQPDPGSQALSLMDAMTALMQTLRRPDYPDKKAACQLARTMEDAGWPWARAILDQLGDVSAQPGTGLDIWRELPEWEDEAPLPPPGDERVSPDEAAGRLKQLLGPRAEDRAAQRDYTRAVAVAFGPREAPSAPNAVLAEAGTGVGKTLGYIAPASLWAEKNSGPVWLSTYTKNLQRQIDQELNRLYRDPAEKARKVVIRKGRENYLCLLNLEEAVARAQLVPENKIRLGLVVRWARYSRDGDMVGGDLPAWLLQRLGAGRASGLTDRRGECIYAGCAHWRKCFIEHSTRKARHADLVVANHALVMVRAARYGHEEGQPTRYIFDEGHHLFEAADSAFSALLSGQEMAELRRWLRGAEQSRRSRARGIESRIGELVEDSQAATESLYAAIRAAAQLPAEGWLARISEGRPSGPAERFLAAVYTHVKSRANDPDGPYSIEASTNEPAAPLGTAAHALAEVLTALGRPMERLARLLRETIAEQSDTLDTATRNRLEAASEGVLWRVQAMVAPWRAMLGTLNDEDHEPDERFIDWFSIDRAGSRILDTGMHRHWVDPTEPFARAVLEPAHGVVVTSATLRDETPDAMTEKTTGEITGDEQYWSHAEMRTGFNHLALPARRSSVPSPFDYGAQTRVLIVTDVNRNDPDQVGAAFEALFKAAGGGGLGLFTAIARLRTAYQTIAAPLLEAGLPLYAQHIDVLDPGTLVDIFRAEKNACLLGTDAVRDGVDVPGDALRLIVFDRVPWPRPTIMHRARRAAFGERGYDDMIARLRLKQAFGRLIRRADDHGVFVMLDPATPSRLLSAFPPGVTPQRLGLREAIEETRAFLG